MMLFIRATILVGKGSDKVMLHTTLPEPCYPYNGFLTMNFDCAQDAGSDYVKKHFPDIGHNIDIIRLD